jgi:hypothetical protein
MSIRIQTEIDEKDAPDFLKECLDKLASDEKAKEYIREYEVIYKLDSYFKRVLFTLDKFHAECHSLKLWAIMELYYFWEVEYDFQDKLFKIGGCETEELSSETLSGLIEELVKKFDEDSKIEEE